MTIWQNITSASRIIIVHPNYRQHRYLLSTLLNLGKVRYWRCDSPLDTTWLHVDTHYDFLILDEFDRLSENEADSFLEQALNERHAAHIVLFSRYLPDLQPQHRSQASLFPIDEALGLVDYYQKSRTVLEFFALGNGAIAVNGKRKDIWQEANQAAILFYLLEKGRATRKTLLETFWPDTSPQLAIKALHNLKQRLNEILGLDLLIFHEGFYQLNPSFEFVYDVANYQRLVEAAYHAPDHLSHKLLSQAHAAYSGDYLQGIKALWTKTLRHALRKTHADAQARLAAMYAQQAQKEVASTWYSFAFKHNPARDDVLMELMKLFLDLGLPCHALSFYQRYEEILRDKHGISPNTYFEKLVEQAKAGCQK